MMDKIHQRLHNDEGFTLVELMVVVLIIAILMAIAIPTFLGARQKAQDRAAQADLRNALTTAKVAYVDSETYVGDDTAASTTGTFKSLEPALVFDKTVGNATDITIGYDGQLKTIVMVKESKSGTFFCIGDDTGGAGTINGSAKTLAELNSFALCNTATAW